MLRLIRIALVLAAHCVAANSVAANNNLFLPGDAFFPTELSQATLGRLQEQENGPYVFEYSTLGTFGMAFCGNAGYPRVAFADVDSQFVDNLSKAYSEIRKRTPRVLRELRRDKVTYEEVNPIKVLFYPAEFDLQRYKLGLRYNEHWVRDVVGVGHRPENVRLCCMVKEPDAVMLSWRDSTFVGAFDVVPPSDPQKSATQDPFGQQTVPKSVPVSIRGKVKAVVLMRESLDDYFSPRRSDYLPLRVVDSTRNELMTYKKGKWVTSAEADSDVSEDPFGN